MPTTAPNKAVTGTPCTIQLEDLVMEKVSGLAATDRTRDSACMLCTALHHVTLVSVVDEDPLVTTTSHFFSRLLSATSDTGVSSKHLQDSSAGRM